MSSPYLPGAPLRIERPGREYHGHPARFLEPGQDPLFAYVALGKGDDKGKLPQEKHYKKSAHALHKLLPLSQLRPLEQPI